MTAPTHFPLDRLAKALRADGINCVVRPGAQGRSARRFSAAYGASHDGYYRGCQAVCQHHTVSSGTWPLNDVTYIESGQGDGFVISNAYTSLGGVVYLIASGPTYTEGRGGPLGIIPQDRGNDVVFSNEIASWGAVDSIYPHPPQQDAIAGLGYHAGLIAADVWEWPDDPFAPHRQFAHFEWAPTRKVDPRGISRWSLGGGMFDMDAFRSELRARNTPTPQPDEQDGDPMGLRVAKIRYESFAEQLVCFRASASTLETGGILDDEVVVLADPTPEQQAAIERALGKPLTRIKVA